ncbi:MAG TPA: hypothetical protein VFB96_06415 [Pirellulaceae bacterium]|jgi:hypothetical protein|nr:hypothetical protein [Pirellulaceae bacterium]
MNRAQLTSVFNLGFRRGANDRAAAGLVITRTETPPPPAEIPAPPAACTTHLDQQAWKEGYTMGYTMGSSDAELASVTEPAAHGMVSTLEQEMLELFGVFKRLGNSK